MLMREFFNIRLAENKQMLENLRFKKPITIPTFFALETVSLVKTFVDTYDEHISGASGKRVRGLLASCSIQTDLNHLKNNIERYEHSRRNNKYEVQLYDDLKESIEKFNENPTFSYRYEYDYEGRKRLYEFIIKLDTTNRNISFYPSHAIQEKITLNLIDDITSPFIKYEFIEIAKHFAMKELMGLIG